MNDTSTLKKSDIDITSGRRDECSPECVERHTDEPGLSVIMGAMFANGTSCGQGERKALATVQRMLHGLNQVAGNSDFFGDN